MKRIFTVWFLGLILIVGAASAASTKVSSNSGSGTSPTQGEQDINKVIARDMKGSETEAISQVLNSVTDPKQKRCLKKAMECSVSVGEDKTKCGNQYNVCMAKK